jgi:glycosyltransferase involved in cell wall biosynthesis
MLRKGNGRCRSVITVAIPTIPQRKNKLRKAVSSVLAQTYPASAISIAVDLDREGSAKTRNRALEAVQTEWVAFLDDDDQLLPHHLDLLITAAYNEEADVVYGLPRVVGTNGIILPRRLEFGGPPIFDPALLERRSYITVSSLVRTELAKEVGGFEFFTDETGGSYDDHGFYRRLLHAGAKFHHVHQETFIWNHDGGNTSGRSDKGDAR